MLPGTPNFTLIPNVELFTDGQAILPCRYSNPKQAVIHAEPIPGLILLPLSRQKSIPVLVQACRTSRVLRL